MGIQIKKLYLCENDCSWTGSFESVEKCPACGKTTLTTQSVTTECSLFYKRGRNLRIRELKSPDSFGQFSPEVIIENADLYDLKCFINEVF